MFEKPMHGAKTCAQLKSVSECAICLSIGAGLMTRLADGIKKML